MITRPFPGPWFIYDSAMWSILALPIVIGGCFAKPDAPSPDSGTIVNACGATEIVAGGSHNCALRGDNTVVCWGNNARGESVPPSSSSTAMCMFGPTPYACLPTPTPVALPSMPVQRIGIGEYHSCAILGDGRMFCWGYNGQEQFGNGNTATGPDLLPQDVARNNATALAAGDAHMCTIVNNSVMCSSENSVGQAGDGSVLLRTAPVPVMPPLVSPVAIGSGLRHTCAIAGPAELWCWGWNGNNQSDPAGTMVPVPTPTRVTDAAGARAVAAGATHTCFINTATGVSCFGDNRSAQLGQGTMDATTIGPIAVPNLAEVTAIAAGGNHTCALKSDGAVWCWGAEETFANLIPAPVPLGQGAKKIAVGTFHACAILLDDTIACWGSNELGQHGDGSQGVAMLAVSHANLCP